MERLNGKSELSRFYLKRELILVVNKFVNSFLLTLTFGQSFRSMSAVAVLCMLDAGAADAVMHNKEYKVN